MMTTYQKKAEKIIKEILTHIAVNQCVDADILLKAKEKLHHDDFELLEKLRKMMPEYYNTDIVLAIASFAVELLELREKIPLYEDSDVCAKPMRLGETLMRDPGDKE